jgi:hypothetical protein
MNPEPQSSEAVSSDPMTDQLSDTPFAARRAELKAAASFEPPRCQTCNELIFNLNPFQVVKYCGKACRTARSKRGQKKLIAQMTKNGLVK